MIGRPVVVLEKKNAVPEHNQYFQLSYKFSSLSLLREPMMLAFGFFLFFVACIVYAHVDLTISKSSASYLSKLQWYEIQTAIQQFQNVMNRCLSTHDKLEASLRDLSRTGDVQTCKAARKSADSTLEELSKDLKPLLSFLQSSSQATQILPKGLLSQLIYWREDETFVWISGKMETSLIYGGDSKSLRFYAKEKVPHRLQHFLPSSSDVFDGKTGELGD